MHIKEFERKLSKLNRHLHIQYGHDISKPAGIWYFAPTYSGGDYQSICGIDKGWIPEHPIANENGSLIKGGWRRAIAILCALNLVDRFKTYELFGKWDEHQTPNAVIKTTFSAIDTEINRVQQKGYYKRDELVDLGREIQKTRPIGA